MPRVSSKQLTKLPASENGVGVTCLTSSGEQYYISQNTEKRKFTLWRIIDGNYQKITTSNSPLDLYDKIEW
jgi:hypothetical protein